MDLRRAAWEALELPESFEDCKQEYWNVFQVGSDGPRISLLLHHALGRPGSSVREDWLRVMSHLGLQWNDVHLPPDQLGAACEVYACAIARNEPVLIEETAGTLSIALVRGRQWDPPEGWQPADVLAGVLRTRPPRSVSAEPIVHREGCVDPR